MVTKAARKWRRLLVSLWVLLAASVVGTLAGAAYLPLAAAVPPPRPEGAATPAQSLARPPLGPPADYAVIHERRLQTLLFDPPPVTQAAPEPPPEPQFTAHLIGTAVDPGFSYALFQTNTGERKSVSVGQTIEDAETLAIQPDSVTVRFHGKTLVLSIEAATEPSKLVPGRATYLPTSPPSPIRPSLPRRPPPTAQPPGPEPAPAPEPDSEAPGAPDHGASTP
jgi:hypothetical protein